MVEIYDFQRKCRKRAGKLVEIARCNLHLLSNYESDALAAPFYYIWHFFWKRIQICRMWFRCRA